MGAFGRVSYAVHQSTSEPFALKALYKGMIISKRRVPHMMNERQLLGACAHPFLPRLYTTFQDRKEVRAARAAGTSRSHVSSGLTLGFGVSPCPNLAPVPAVPRNPELTLSRSYHPIEIVPRQSSPIEIVSRSSIS